MKSKMEAPKEYGARANAWFSSWKVGIWSATAASRITIRSTGSHSSSMYVARPSSIQSGTVCRKSDRGTMSNSKMWVSSWRKSS